MPVLVAWLNGRVFSLLVGMLRLRSQGQNQLRVTLDKILHLAYNIYVPREVWKTSRRDIRERRIFMNDQLRKALSRLSFWGRFHPSTNGGTHVQVGGSFRLFRFRGLVGPYANRIVHFKVQASFQYAAMEWSARCPGRSRCVPRVNGNGP